MKRIKFITLLKYKWVKNNQKKRAQLIKDRKLKENK